MQCQECGTPLTADVTACPQCQSPMASPGDGALIHCASFAADAQKTPVYLQLLGIIDGTGSSLKYRRGGIIEPWQMLLDEVTPYVARTTCWIAVTRDLEHGEAPEMPLRGGSTDEAQAAVESIDFEGGGDAEETHLHGIQWAVDRVPWHHEALSRGAVVAFLTDDTKQFGCDLTPHELGGQIGRMGLMFHLIANPTPRLRELVDGVRSEGGEAELIEISNTPDIEQLKRAARQAGRSMSTSIVRGKTEPMSR